MRVATSCLLILAFFGGWTLHAPAADLGLKVPEGFEVTHYADDDLAHNIYSMTLDALGRVVVAGPDYVKILEDTDGDGRADKAKLFSSLPKSGAHGMCFDGTTLYCTGDNGIWRFKDADGDDRADDEGEKLTTLGHSEHGCNGIVRGPDGWFYVVCGNDAGVSKAHVTTDSSPVKDPKCGAIVRFHPDGKQWEVVAHGFRNPYDLAFDADAHLFTVDSDNEREHALPWYAPTRLFDVAIGMEHGWLERGWQQSWNRPEWFFDNVERLVEFGRGSPTGLVVYNSQQFPKKYHGAIFSCCWTLGRVYAVFPRRDGATFKAEHEIFLQTAGGVGFAPCDIATGHDGSMFVAVGGRGTKGSVFRIRSKDLDELASDLDIPYRKLGPLSLALGRAEPWFSQSRDASIKEETTAEYFQRTIQGRDSRSQEIIRAIEILTGVFDGLDMELVQSVMARRDSRLVERVAWSLSRKPDRTNAANTLIELTRWPDAAVQRAAWEGLFSLPTKHLATSTFTTGSWLGVDSVYSRIRAAAIGVQRMGLRSPYHGDEDPLLAGWLTPDSSSGNVAYLRKLLLATVSIAAESNCTQRRLEGARQAQRILGDVRIRAGIPEVFAGVSGILPDWFNDDDRKAIANKIVPSVNVWMDSRLRWEMLRLAAMIQVDDPRLIEYLCRQDRSRAGIIELMDVSSADDIHCLIVAARLPTKRTSEFTEYSASTLANLHAKLAAEKNSPDRFFPVRITQLFDELSKLDPNLPLALVNNPNFGRAEHSLFALRLDGEAQKIAARKLLATAQKNDETPWTADLVKVVASLPDDEALPVLRERWEDFGVRDAIAVVLADRHQAADRARLVEALEFPQADVIAKAATALTKYQDKAAPADMAKALSMLRQYCTAPEPRNVRQALVTLLQHWSGEQFSVEETKGADLAKLYQPWFVWFAKAQPDESAKLNAARTADAAAWKERLTKVDFSGGNQERGKLVFEKRACHRCHTGGGKLGPSLVGAANRFSRDDLIAAVVDPSKDVAPLYQTTQLVTRAGQVYHGLLVYDSVDGILLQTTPDQTVRVTGDELAARYPSRQSLMPTGLLNGASDQDVADLYEFLKNLKKD